MLAYLLWTLPACTAAFSLTVVSACCHHLKGCTSHAIQTTREDNDHLRQLFEHYGSMQPPSPSLSRSLRSCLIFV
jgi:hypothetical protein